MSKTVLIIDDDKYFRRLMGLILQREGFVVEFADDGQTGVERVRTAPPDLVILDYIMPGIDGLEVCRRIRAFSTVPILFLSVVDQEQVRREALECGSVYLMKPFHIDELRTHIGALLSAGDDRS